MFGKTPPVSGLAQRIHKLRVMKEVVVTRLPVILVGDSC